MRTDAVMGAAAGDKERRLGVEGIRAYASLLGDEEAEKWSQSQAGIYDRMFADAEAHKAAVQRAYQRHYQTKAFDED